MTGSTLDFSQWVRPELRGLKPYASARALQGQSAHVVALNANENPWPLDGQTPLNRYPDPQPAALVVAWSEHLAVSPDQVLVTRGSDEGIDLLIRLMIRPGLDQVLVCPPCFGMYTLYAQIQGAKVVEVPLIKGQGRWAMDWSAIGEAPKCRVYFLCSPNNPTGHVTSAVDMLAFAKQVQDHGVVVIDEAYIEFCDEPSMVSMIAHQPNVVVLRTLSKAFGLAGARLGAVVANPELIGWLKRIIAPYPLPTPSIEAALAAFEPAALALQQQHVERLATNKQALLKALKSLSFIKSVWPGEANFVLLEVNDADALMRHCLSDGVVLRNQSHQLNLSQCVRITIGTEQETQQLIDCLNRYPAASE